MENKNPGNHWGNWIFGAITGGLVVGAMFGNVKLIIANLVFLVLFVTGFVVRWIVLKVWDQCKTPAVAASTLDCVVEPQAQSVSVPIPATQFIQKINKTVVAGVVAAVVTVAGFFYLFLVVSANQAYEKAAMEHDQAVAANKNIESEIDAMVKAALGVKEEPLPAGFIKEPDYDPSPEKMNAEIHELAMLAAAGVKSDRIIQPPFCCKDTEYALEKAEITKRYPLASLFNKMDNSPHENAGNLFGVSLIAYLPLAMIILFAWGISRVIKEAAKKYPSVAPDQSTVSGVGGWLLLLILGLMFLGPLIGAGRINSDFMSAESQYPDIKTVAEWATYKSATWWTFLLVCCLSFYTGLNLIKGRNLLVVERAKIILWVNGPAANLLIGVFIPILIFGKSEPDPQFVGSMIASVIAAAIWTAYLSKSKRVKATYGNK